VNKTLGTQIILTSDDIRQWHEDIQRAERQKREADEIIADRRRKLDAAAIFGVKVAPIQPAPEGQEESFYGAVLRIGASFDRLVEHHEIQAELRKIPRFAAMLDKNKGAYYYAVILRLKNAGEIKKLGRKLRFIHKNETPPEGNPEGAS